MKNRTLFLFYILVCYVFIQFFWWAYSIINLNHEIYLLKNEIINLQEQTEEQYYLSLKSLHAKLNTRKWMVFGEGSIFLLLISLGAYMVQNAFKKEIALTNQKKNFLMAVTHELKTPVASAKLQLETLLKHDLPREKQVSILQNAIDDTNRLSQLIDNILVASSIDNNNYTITKETFDLCEFVSPITKKWQDLYKEKGSINFSCPSPANVFADKHTLTSLFNNLLDNSLKYSDKSRKLIVNINVNIKTEKNFTLTFSDNGIGIDKSERENIFKKFYRIGSEETRIAKGTGLGLYIIKNLLAQNGATIKTVDNTEQGTTFEINFV